MLATLTRSDYEGYLIRLYFGKGDYLNLCIDCAYLDFSRALHGIASIGAKPREKATSALRSALGNLGNGKPTVDSQDAFDDWHRDTCQTLATVFSDNGYKSLFVGQAQKWINMAFKYIFTMGESRVQGFAGFYGYCHAPIDNVVLRALKKHGFPGLPCSWSQLDDYGVYLECQEWIRRRFRILPPMDVEFRLWMGEDLDVST